MNCKCTMAQCLVGDGCEVCNPEMAREIALDNHNCEGGYCEMCPEIVAIECLLIEQTKDEEDEDERD